MRGGNSRTLERFVSSLFFRCKVHSYIPHRLVSTMLGPEAWQQRQRQRSESQDIARREAQRANRERTRPYEERRSLSRRSVEFNTKDSEERRKALEALTRTSYKGIETPQIRISCREPPAPIDESQEIVQAEEGPAAQAAAAAKRPVCRSSRFSLFRRSQRQNEQERAAREQMFKLMRQRPLYHCPA